MQVLSQRTITTQIETTAASLFTPNQRLSYFARNTIAIPWLLEQRRNMAFITGHANTKRKNRKKRTAKAIDNQKLIKKRMSDDQYREHQRTRKLQRREQMSLKNAKSKQGKRVRRFDPSTTPNYPLGPNGLTDQIDNEDGTTTIITPSDAKIAQHKSVVIPPAVLLPTGSFHVFVAKVACQEMDMDPRKTLFASPDLYIKHDPKLRTAYTFEPYGPLFTVATSNQTTVSNHNQPKHQHNLTMSEKPEVAFIGRSNVGKSSLINALMNQTLAVTSKQPGRTQQAYYYGWIPTGPNHPHNRSHPSASTTKSSHVTSIPITAAQGFLVDLPGYGYAVGPHTAVETWQVATQDYLRQRRDAQTLQRVYVLQDSRLQSPQPIDGEVLRWLEEEHIPHTVVLTKADDHHTTQNQTNSTAGVIKHANICCYRYYHLWSDSGATLPDDNTDQNEVTVDADDESDDGELPHDSLYDDNDGGTSKHNSNSDEWYDEAGSDKSDEDNEEKDEEDDDDDDEEEEMIGAIMLSPIVHVTSSKKQTGLSELLSSIESEFTLNTDVELRYLSPK
jgi:GTP-binding protein EngB required for normal cell division